MTVYVFDMDGTLTPARLPMTAEFAIHFYEWQKNHKSFIATGSDLKKGWRTIAAEHYPIIQRNL